MDTSTQKYTQIHGLIAAQRILSCDAYKLFATEVNEYRRDLELIEVLAKLHMKAAESTSGKYLGYFGASYRDTADSLFMGTPENTSLRAEYKLSEVSVPALPKTADADLLVLIDTIKGMPTAKDYEQLTAKNTVLAKMVADLKDLLNDSKHDITVLEASRDLEAPARAKLIETHQAELAAATASADAAANKAADAAAKSEQRANFDQREIDAWRGAYEGLQIYVNKLDTAVGVKTKEEN